MTATTLVKSAELSQPHLLIKRGHLGRYRFTLLSESGRLTGEVRVETDGTPRAEQDASARSEIQKLAATFLALADVDGEMS